MGRSWKIIHWRKIDVKKMETEDEARRFKGELVVILKIKGELKNVKYK